MTADQREVRLTSQEVMYLKNTDFLPVPLKRVIDAAQAISPKKYIVRVSRDTSEQLRSSFTDRLAKVGFDANYELTSEGQLLEELITRFYFA
jgi:hypothetical protein